MDSVYFINIERAILSSILFNPDEFEEAKKIIGKKDFYLPAHQRVFEAMNELNEELMPIDEEFLRKKISFKEVDDSVLIEILSANPITNIEAYLKEIKESSIKRKILDYTNQIKRLVADENNSSSKILSELEDNLNLLSKQNSEDFLKAIPLSEITEEDTTYICKKFIPFPEYSVGIISAKGGMGKTFAALKICDEYIEEKHQETGVYKKTLIIATEDRAGKLKARANKLNLKHQKFIQISSIYSFDVLEKDFKTQNWKLTEDFYKFKTNSVDYDLIIIDPMISFYSGKENDNGDAKAFMKPFVKLADERNQNIIFLHHSDKGGTGSRGAGAFADATRLTYFVTKETEKDDDGKIVNVPDSRKLRFEIQKQNDDISSVKKLDDIKTVGDVGSFLVDVFPIKVDTTEFKSPDKPNPINDNKGTTKTNSDFTPFDESNFTEDNISTFAKDMDQIIFSD